MNTKLQAAYRAARATHNAKNSLSIARESIKLSDLGLPRYPQNSVITIDSTMFTVKVEHDSDSSPFEWDCFHATPTHCYDAPSRDSAAGYAFITDSNGQFHVYPRAEAIQTCLSQMLKHDRKFPRCTRYEQAVEAVDAEIEYWRQWLNDDRYFIGVIVTAESSEGFTAESSCWGIEAGDHEGYWRSIASDLISDCQHEITQQRVDRACALDDALTADFAGIQFA